MEITVKELAIALRLLADPNDPIDPAISGVLTRQLAVAKAIVDHHAPAAPQEVKNEAIVRTVGYLYDSPTAGRGANYASVFRNSGAASLLTKWVERRIPTDEEASTSVPINIPAGQGLSVSQVQAIATNVFNSMVADFAKVGNSASLPNNKISAAAIILSRLAANVAARLLPTGATNGQVAIWDGTANKWILGSAPSGGEIADGSITIDKLNFLLVRKLLPNGSGTGNILEWDGNSNIWRATTLTAALASLSSIPLRDGSITESKYADDSVSERAMDDDSVGGDQIKAKVVANGHLVDSPLIENKHLFANSVEGDNIAAEEIEEGHLDAGLKAKVNAAPDLKARLDMIPTGREISIAPTGSPARTITLPADYRTTYDLIYINWPDNDGDVEVSLSIDLLPTTGTRQYRSAGRGRVTWNATARTFVLSGMSGNEGFRNAELYQAGVAAEGADMTAREAAAKAQEAADRNKSEIDEQKRHTSDIHVTRDEVSYQDYTGADALFTFYPISGAIGQEVVNKSMYDAATNAATAVWRFSGTVPADNIVLVRVKHTVDAFDYAFTFGSAPTDIEDSDVVGTDATWQYFFVGQTGDSGLGAKMQSKEHSTHSRYEGELGGPQRETLDTVEETIGDYPLFADVNLLPAGISGTELPDFIEVFLGKRVKPGTITAVRFNFNGFADFTLDTSGGKAGVPQIQSGENVLRFTTPTGVAKTNLENNLSGVTAPVAIDLYFTVGGKALRHRVRFPVNDANFAAPAAALTEKGILDAIGERTTADRGKFLAISDSNENDIVYHDEPSSGDGSGSSAFTPTLVKSVNVSLAATTRYKASGVVVPPNKTWIIVSMGGEGAPATWIYGPDFYNLIAVGNTASAFPGGRNGIMWMVATTGTASRPTFSNILIGRSATNEILLNNSDGNIDPNPFRVWVI